MISSGFGVESLNLIRRKTTFSTDGYRDFRIGKAILPRIGTMIPVKTRIILKIGSTNVSIDHKGEKKSGEFYL